MCLPLRRKATLQAAGMRFDPFPVTCLHAAATSFRSNLKFSLQVLAAESDRPGQQRSSQCSGTVSAGMQRPLRDKCSASTPALHAPSNSACTHLHLSAAHLSSADLLCTPRSPLICASAMPHSGSCCCCDADSGHGKAARRRIACSFSPSTSLLTAC